MFRPLISWFRAPRLKNRSLSTKPTPRGRAPLNVECLEDRLTPSNYLVDNASDIDDNNVSAGQLTLREAIRLANGDAAADIIFFSQPLSNNTIVMTGPTYVIATPMTITAVFNVTQATNLAIDGGNARTIFHVEDGNNSALIDVVINGLTLTRGASTTTGGAIRVGADNLSVFNCTLVNSTAPFGGAIAFQSGVSASGRLVIGNSTIINNSAAEGGGGVLLSSGSAIIFNSTFAGNSAGNSSGTGGTGGAFQIQDNSLATITNCTIANNYINQAAGVGTGGAINVAGATLTLNNTIIAGNGIGPGGTQNDIAGQVSAASVSNIVGNAATSGGLTQGVNGNFVGDNGAGTLPLISIVYPRLFGNGGPTATFAIVPNSPAIDRGNNSRALDHTNRLLVVDQRGLSFQRFVNNVIDIGALELQADEAPGHFRTTLGPNLAGTAPVAAATALARFSMAANLTQDLAVADSANNSISIFLNNNASGFMATPAITLSLPANASPGALLVADFNGDLKPDLAVANSGISGAAAISVFLNTTIVPGTPTFGPRVDLDGPNNPNTIVAANIDNDASGRLDLVVLSRTVNAVGNFTFTVFFGLGGGAFGPGSALKLGDASPDAAEIANPSSLAVGDILGDAKPDLLVTGSNGANYLTNISTLGSPGFLLNPNRFSSSNNTAAVIGRIDGDTLNDMAYATTIAGGNVVVFRNNGGGSFNGAGFAANFDPVALRLADINADGKNDFLLANGAPGRITFLINNTTTSTISLAAPLGVHLGGSPRGFAVGDLNVNNIPDIATANGAAGIDVLLGNAGFPPHTFVVDSAGDTNDGDYSAGKLTLREALVLANINAGRDFISFAASLTAGGAVTINLTSDLPTIIESLSIAGPGAGVLAINGQSTRRILNIDDGNNAADIDVALSGLHFRNGKADGGGAIRSRENLTISNCKFTTNQSNTLSGGAIAAVDAGSLAIYDSSFTSNSSAATSGGAIFTDRPTTIFGCAFTSNNAANGGALFANAATMSIASSAFSGNAADLTVGSGGAIQVAGGVVSLVNCTLSGNSAMTGGGIAIAAAASATITNATITGNTAGNGTGGGVLANGTVALHNSIVAGNTASPGSTPSDVAGTLATASTNNIIGNAATSGGLTEGANNNIVGVSGAGTRAVGTILNTTLANNGGATATHALVQNSLAIGAASESAPGFTHYDQREAARDVAAPDIGAFEVQHPLSPVGVPSDDERTFAPQPSPDTNTAFIKGLYHATLLRDAEPDGLAFWINQLNAGVTREAVALGFINSFENRGNQVAFFYRYFLRREAEPEGLNFHVARLRSGIDEATVMVGFILSPEFAGQNNNASFVNLMYYAVLGRQAEPSGFASWKHELDTGHMSRDQVVAAFLRSQEGIGRVVQTFFFSYLKRPADSDGGPFFVNLLASGNTFGTVAAKILASDDFYFLHAAQNRS
jgi:hypothetical protein